MSKMQYFDPPTRNCSENQCCHDSKILLQRCQRTVCNRSIARNGDQEAQRVNDQLTDAPDVLRLISAANQEEPVGAVLPAQPSSGTEHKADDKEELQNHEPQPGEPDADEAMAEDRKRIRTLLDQAGDTPGTAGDASSTGSSGVAETTLRPKKAKTQPDSQG
eukprot:1269716-Amphidinium_carterae.2